MSSRVAAPLYAHIMRLGTVTTRRLYGDFSGSRQQGWLAAESPWTLEQRHVPQNSPGKNSSDIALVIDAMDLLRDDRHDGFCLVTSDGDFTRLALRISDHGLPVWGFGQSKAPITFQRACTTFVDVDALTADADSRRTAAPTTTARFLAPKGSVAPTLAQATARAAAAITTQSTATKVVSSPAALPAKSAPVKSAPVKSVPVKSASGKSVPAKSAPVKQTAAKKAAPAKKGTPAKQAFAPTSAKSAPKQAPTPSPSSSAVTTIVAALLAADDKGGWVKLSALGTHLRNVAPGFTPKTYGHATLSKLVRACGGLEIKGNGAGIVLRPDPRVRMRVVA